MRRTGLLTALLVCRLAAPADAAPRPFGVPGHVRATDGERFAIFARTDGSLVVLDDRGPRRELALPACPDPGQTSKLVGLGGGMALTECSGASGQERRDPRVIDLATGAARAPAGMDDLRRAHPDHQVHPVAAGRHWLLVSLESERGGSFVYLNWRTGAVRRDDVTEQRRRVVPDLDLPTLDRRLCRGARRTIFVVGHSRGSGETAQYDSEFQYRDRHILEGGRLRRCGARRSVKLATYGARLGPGRATWPRQNRVFVLPLRRGARPVRLTLEPAGRPTAWLLTGMHAYAVRGDRTWVARLPR